MIGTITLTRKGLRVGNRILPCSIGRGGITDHKREGDGATPTGTHHIAQIFYRADRLTRPCPWAIPIGPCDLWCDAPDHAAYNMHVRAPFNASHEALRRADPIYDVILTTDWNWPQAKPGRGSAIFLHQWRRPRFPTAGCLAFARNDLLWLTRQIAPGTQLIISSVLKYPGVRGRAPFGTDQL